MRAVITVNTILGHLAWAGTVVQHPTGAACGRVVRVGRTKVPQLAHLANCLPFCKRGHEQRHGDVLGTV